MRGELHAAGSTCKVDLTFFSISQEIVADIALHENVVLHILGDSLVLHCADR